MFRFTLILTSILALAPRAHSFCGVYVAGGASQLFNHRSQVVMARDADHTVLTMASDYEGEPQQFALVVPVPEVLDSSQVHVGENALVEHIDQWSTPRLVEYWDPDPCPRPERLSFDQAIGAAPMMARGGRARDVRQLEEVQIEAKFSVAEYDILILSATESHGLVRWLTQHGYRIPPAAAPVIASYLRQGMKFFVAKVNLGERRRLGITTLRPLQIAYTSSRFMLPIRLGMANARGPQELFVYALTRRGRVECTNYRTLKLPTDRDVPEFVRADWNEVYPALFAHQCERSPATVFTEYAWSTAGCDPCAAPPLAPEELRGLGVFWLDQSPQAFVTRLHVRYDRGHFPEDLVFQETPDVTPWQARYVMRHPWTGACDCDQGRRYAASLPARRHQEAETLADLTGWPVEQVLTKMPAGSSAAVAVPWWKRLWH